MPHPPTHPLSCYVTHPLPYDPLNNVFFRPGNCASEKDAKVLAKALVKKRGGALIKSLLGRLSASFSGGNGGGGGSAPPTPGSAPTTPAALPAPPQGLLAAAQQQQHL